jgi:small subunit ribosomal protein S20
LTVSTSFQKAARVAERKRTCNKPVRSSVKTQVKTAEKHITANELEQAEQAVSEAVSALDRAARKKVIHRNSAGRQKSRLMAKLHGTKTTQTSK